MGEDFILEIATYFKKNLSLQITSHFLSLCSSGSRHISEFTFQSLPVTTCPLEASHTKRRTRFFIHHVFEHLLSSSAHRAHTDVWAALSVVGEADLI